MFPIHLNTSRKLITDIFMKEDDVRLRVSPQITLSRVEQCRP